MAPTEKETKVAADSTPPRTPDRLHLAPVPEQSLDASLSPSQCPTPHDEYDPSSSHPFSPFYSHPASRTCSEQPKNDSSSAAFKVYETDLESGSKRFSMEPLSTRNTPQKDCTVWPSMRTLKQERKQRKKKAGCSPWNRLNKKQRLWTRIILLLLTVGFIVGLAVGITKAVHGGVYRSPSEQSQIGQGD